MVSYHNKPARQYFASLICIIVLIITTFTVTPVTMASTIINVPCDVPSLIAAINTANGQTGFTLARTH